MTLRIATPRFPSFPTRPESSPRRRSRRRALFRPRLDGLEDRALLAAGVLTLAGSTFEIDGNLTVDNTSTNMDWGSYANPDGTISPQLTVQKDNASGSTDNSFGQGTKEDTAVPTVVSGSIPNNKSDLTRFYMAQNRGTVTLSNNTTQTHQFIYLAWERANTLGTANIDFELNQSKTPSTNGVTPNRTIGDLLISFDFAQGGNTVNLTMRTWNGTAWGSPQSLPPSAALGAVNDVGFNYGSVNYTNPIPDPLNNNKLLAPDTFGEAAIDLTAAGIFPATPTSCESFASAYVKSRSSASFTSELKDFIAPATVNVTNCADIIVQKATSPSPDPTTTTFNFTGTGTSPYDPSTGTGVPSAFSLANGQSVDFDVLPGTYTLNELVPQGWTLQSVTSTGTTGITWNGHKDTTNSTSVTVNPEDKVTILYTDAAQGQIIVHKTSVSTTDNNTTTFTFTTTGAGYSGFNLKGGQQNSSGALPIGTYSVSELVPAGWDLTGLTITSSIAGDTNDSVNLSTGLASIKLDPGETVNVSYTDTQRGKIIVDKTTVPSTDTTTLFPFSTTGTGYTAGFPLKNGQTNTSDWLVPGNFSVTENVPSGWALTGLSLSTNNGSKNDSTNLASGLASITLDPGETVHVSYVDTQQAHIVVHKATSTYPDPDTSTLFTFTPSYNGGSTFKLAGGGSNDSGALLPGTYTVNETGIQSGWHFTSLVVAPPAGGSSTFTTSGTLASANLAAGEAVDVYYTDTQPALNLNVGISPIKENDQTYLTGTIHDLGGGNQAIQINWGDGTIQTIASPVVVDSTGLATFNVVHRYLDDSAGLVDGVYPIQVTVTDSPAVGPAVTSIKDTSVVVTNVTPLPSAGTSATINEGDTLSRAGSFTDPGTKDTWTAMVDYGDKSGVQPLTLNPDKTFNLSHTYGVPDTYVVTIYVSDGEAGPGPSLVGMTDVGTATFTVTVNDVAPSLNAMSDLVVQAGTSFNIAEGFTDPGFPETFTYDVNWNDGSTDSTGSATAIQGSAGVPTKGSLTASHVYNPVTTTSYMVTVTVTDQYGKSSSTTFKVTVLGSLIS